MWIYLLILLICSAAGMFNDVFRLHRTLHRFTKTPQTWWRKQRPLQLSSGHNHKSDTEKHTHTHTQHLVNYRPFTVLITKGCWNLSHFVCSPLQSQDCAYTFLSTHTQNGRLEMQLAKFDKKLIALDSQSPDSPKSVSVWTFEQVVNQS